MDKLDILRYIGGEYIQLRDVMVHEMTLRLEISGVTGRTLYCSPSELKELVIVHLYTQGYIQTSSPWNWTKRQSQPWCRPHRLKGCIPPIPD